MNKLPIYFLSLVFALTILTGCFKEDFDTSWKEQNDQFFNKMKTELGTNGLPLYKQLRPDWDTTICILYRSLKEGTGNRTPYYTSVVSVKYKGTLNDGIAFDSSYIKTDSVLTTKVSSTIVGWQIALQYMVEGDHWEVIVPQTLGYGENGFNDIPGFSTLVFDMTLKSIPKWEKP